jgi:hypothetical protein
MRLAHGALAVDEHIGLVEEAGATEEGRALYEMWRPFDAEERARLVAAVRDLVAGKRPRGIPASLALYLEVDAMVREVDAILAGGGVRSQSSTEVTPHGGVRVELVFAEGTDVETVRRGRQLVREALLHVETAYATEDATGWTVRPVSAWNRSATEAAS